MASTTANRPTSQQLSYLTALAERTGQTFTYPQTRRQASDIATGPLDAARVRDDEISGRGRSATWVHNRDQKPPPVADPGSAPARRRRGLVVGKRTELARYTVADGERILYGQRIDGIVRVTDRPAGTRGRAYVVERGLETKGELDALILDYLEQAAKLDSRPVATTSSLLASMNATICAAGGRAPPRGKSPAAVGSRSRGAAGAPPARDL